MSSTSTTTISTIISTMLLISSDAVIMSSASTTTISTTMLPTSSDPVIMSSASTTTISTTMLPISSDAVIMSSASTTTISTISTVLPTSSDADERGTDTVIRIVIPIIVVVIAFVIAFVTLSFVISMCIKTRKKYKQKGVDNPIYNAHSKYGTKGNAYCPPSIVLSNNPAYNMELSSTISFPHLNGRIVSEHMYETCYDPYDYLEPISTVAKSNIISNFDTRERVSAIYEVPSHVINSGSTDHLSQEQEYLTPCNISQSIPISPGYEVPIMNLPFNALGDEESRYHQPGWIYRSGSNHMHTIVKHL